MKGIIRASARLLAMGFVMAAVLALSTYAGLSGITALALSLLSAGAVGIVSFTMNRRPRKASAADEIAAMMAPVRAAAAAAPAGRPEQVTAVEAMAPPEIRELDPEANMPRWRRPSLLEARRSDPGRYSTANRAPLRFTDDQVYQFDVRIVRYAVVPLLDRPDEVLGIRVADLESGDEVQVLSAQGAFVEIHCPNGGRGWVHRTTLRQRDVGAPAYAAMQESQQDLLGAVLSARGLPQS